MNALIETLESWIDYRDDVTGAGLTIGFVPTMGALHEGHLELIRKARQETDCVVLSVFLNPTQFNDPKDYEQYPKTLGRDRELAVEAGADAVLAPSKDVLYPDGYNYKI